MIFRLIRLRLYVGSHTGAPVSCPSRAGEGNCRTHSNRVGAATFRASRHEGLAATMIYTHVFKAYPAFKFIDMLLQV